MRPTTFLYTYWNIASESAAKSARSLTHPVKMSHMRASQRLAEASQNASESDPGLSLTAGIVYNDRQNLPLTMGTLPMAPDGSSLTSEADMKPARSEQTPSSVSASPSKTGAAGVETRAERLERIRREIQEGTYESEEKLERAIERMLGVLHTAND